MEGFLSGKSEESKELYRAFMREYKEIGNFTLHPAKTRVALLVKMRFASVNRLGKDFLDGHLVLKKPYHSAKCFYRIDKYGSNFVHRFRIKAKGDITPELRSFMRIAYIVGKKEFAAKNSYG